MAPNDTLQKYLLSRRSVTMPFLAEPGPDAGQLDQMLTMATRVPDHGKLAPWRLVMFRGDARKQAGEALAQVAKSNDPVISDERLEAERKQFLPAPLTIGVLSSPVDHPKIPQFEQLLSAGCVALNLVHAANSFGFGAHWVTRWFAYDEAAAEALGAKSGERFVGFIHIGAPETHLGERDRPELSKIVSDWTPAT